MRQRGLSNLLNGMRNKKPDKKNILLAKTLYELRQAIDVHRVIGLNGEALGDKAGKSYLYQTQAFAEKIITLNICKVYEYEKRYPLNSISGIIVSLPDKIYRHSVIRQVKAFCSKYGEGRKSERSVVLLRRTLRRFKADHRKSLRRLKAYRDKQVAHSEYPLRRRWLPPDRLRLFEPPLESVWMVG